MTKMRVVLVVLLFITGCDWDSEPPRVVETGMLSVIDPAACGIPEGCGPKYRIWDQELKSFMPLLGPINDSHHQLIISVRGQVVPLPPEQAIGFNYTGPFEAILAEDYVVHSSIPYHDYLVPAARTHAEAIYGCFIPWNKTFGWSLDAGVPEIWVRMTHTLSNDTPLPFVQFTFDGRAGALLETIDNLSGESPCTFEL